MTRRFPEKPLKAKARSAGLREEARPPVLAVIRGILPSLHPTERAIAERILADPEKVVVSSIGALAKRCRASTGSISGFCRQLGLQGFGDFKMALACDLAQSGLPAASVAQEGSLFKKVFHFQSQSLAETGHINPEATLERVAQAIEKARKIEFFSIGLSHPVAYTACSKFLLLGLPAFAHVDSHLQVMAATQMNAGEVAFAVSCSGTTSETVQCLAVAKAKGATTICLTNAMNSRITAFSDLCLYAAPSEINYFQAPLASRITQLALIDALFVYLAIRHKETTGERLRQSVEVLHRREFL